MASLHLPTMLWAMLLLSFTLAGSVLLVAYRTRVRDGLHNWGWGMLVHGLSYSVFAMRYYGWLDASVLVSNLLVAGTMSLHLLAVAQFQHGRVPPLPRWLVWGPLLLVAAVCVLLLHAHQWRILVLALVFAAQSLLLAWQAMAPGLTGSREYGRVLLIAGSTLLAVVLLVRFVSVLTGPRWEAQVAVPDSLQAVTYLFTLVTLLMNTIGYVLMHKEHAADLQHEQATHDALTGIFNRRALLEQMRLGVSAASRNSAELGVLMLDLDHFKRVNDEHGHQAGDAVLREATQRVRQRLRLHDVLGRYGGEEFLVVLEHTSVVSATGLAEDIRRVIEAQPFTFQGKAIPVTLSIGVHVRQPENTDQAVDEMIAAADRALYRAKQNGRNRVEISG